MKRTLLLLLLTALATGLSAQENIQIINPAVETILFGEAIPENLPITPPSEMAQLLVDDLRPDSLRSYLIQMSAFGNRNTGSDTVSTTFGIGAARRWAHDKFQQFSDQSGGRLQVGYLQFDQDICGMGQHRNILAVLPGVGPHAEEFVLVEAHFDSRCEGGCDITCNAAGMEDNGSGSALVLELARVMANTTTDRTMVFMLTIGEEQGLFGAEAFSKFVEDNQLPLRAVFNNDIVGGIICGQTASPPGCPGLNDIDSTNVRIYSHGNIYSQSKSLARFTKMQYEQDVFDLMPYPTVINLMSPEDRTGRGGDHIPFRQAGYPAIRFTSANEHGDGNPSQAGYSDRQHTHDDDLGLDTDGDGIVDSFFVDFNYLNRNAIINGYALHTAASGPPTPELVELEAIDNVGIRVEITDPANTGRYLVGVRQQASLEFQYLFEFDSKIDTITELPDDVLFFFSAAAVDDQDRESLFWVERFADYEVPTSEIAPHQGVELLQNRPNPFDEATYFGVYVSEAQTGKTAEILVNDLTGKVLKRLPIGLQPGLNEVLYGFEHHGYVPGTYSYTLVIDGTIVATRRMVYAW